LENGLPPSYVMQVIEGPLAIDRGKKDSVNSTLV
jgi:hypothetical protein